MSTRTLLLAVLLSCGCSQRNYNVADPVVGPIPPRIADASSVAAQSESPGNIRQVKHETTEPLAMTDVIARVNGKPILAGAVLEQYQSKLTQLRAQVSDEDYRRAQEMVIQRDLPNIIEQTLMVDAVKAKLEKEQLDAVQGQLDEFFEVEVERLKKQFKVDTHAALEGVLQSQGMSLVTMRRLFGERQLAGEYVRGKLGDDPVFSRQELIAEYQSRLKEFEQPAKVKWQQLQVSKEQHGEAGATRKMNEVLSELRSGADFTALVKKYSDGPLASDGGNWDWTQPDSIANAELRATLDKLQLNEVSRPISNEKSLRIVKLTGRQLGGHTPFEEVQEQIRAEMVTKHREEKAQQIIDELKETAIIETIFDEPDGEVRL